MLNILGAAINNIIIKQLEKNATPGETTIMSESEAIIDACVLNQQSLEILKVKIESDAIEDICTQIPQELNILKENLRKSVIEINKLGTNF
jgi:hydrogenase maturation factor